MKTCPKCLTKINNPEATFCYNCGGRIDVENTLDKNENYISTIKEDLTNKREAINSKDADKNTQGNSFKTTDTLSKRWNYFIVGVNALSVMFLVVALGFFFRSVNNTKTGLNMYPVVTIENVVIEESSKITLTDFVNKSQYYNIVPKTVSSYSEITDVEKVLTNTLSKDNIGYLEKTFDMKFDDFLVFFKKDFAYTRKDGDYAFIFKVGGFDFFDRAYSKYQENKKESAGIYAKRVGEFFVLSNSTNLINTMESVTQGTEASLGSDPKFKTFLSDVSINTVYFSYFSYGNNYKDFVEKELPKLNLTTIQKYVVKFKPSLLYLAKEGNKYVLYPIE